MPCHRRTSLDESVVAIWPLVGKPLVVEHRLRIHSPLPQMMRGMIRTAQQHAKLAAICEKLSTDQYASGEQKVRYGRKARWHRILSRIAAQFGLVALPE
jgi:hypothetical protein